MIITPIINIIIIIIIIIIALHCFLVLGFLKHLVTIFMINNNTNKINVNHSIGLSTVSVSLISLFQCYS